MPKDTLFSNPDPNYKPHLRQSGTITDFKTFEQSLQEYKFCKSKLKEAKDKSERAAALAREPFNEEIELLQKQLTDLWGNFEQYLLSADEETKEKLQHISDVEIEEIHKYKIKFKKGDKKDAA